MKRILVIDDEPNLLMMMTETLQLLGFETLAANGGSTGIEMAAGQKPDLIICDLNMPSVDGFETLKGIRGAEATAHIPFVLLSGYADNSTRRQAEGLGASAIMTKPFSTSELLATLNLQLKEAA